MFGLVGTSPFLKIALWVTKETMHFYTAEQAYFLGKLNVAFRDTR